MRTHVLLCLLFLSSTPVLADEVINLGAGGSVHLTPGTPVTVTCGGQVLPPPPAVHANGTILVQTWCGTNGSSYQNVTVALTGASQADIRNQCLAAGYGQGGNMIGAVINGYGIGVTSSDQIPNQAGESSCRPAIDVGSVCGFIASRAY